METPNAGMVESRQLPASTPTDCVRVRVRLVAEVMAEDPQLPVDAAVKRIGPRVGVVPDTLRN